MAKKDDIEPEEIKKQTNELQQASLKLFEMAYKKVCSLRKNLYLTRLQCFIARNRERERELLFKDIDFTDGSRKRKSKSVTTGTSTGRREERGEKLIIIR